MEGIMVIPAIISKVTRINDTNWTFSQIRMGATSFWKKNYDLFYCYTLAITTQRKTT